MTPTQLPLDLGWRRSAGAGDFIVGEANAEAVAWIDCWPEWPLGTAGRSLLLLGPEATGKTHLAQVWRQRSEAGYTDDPARLQQAGGNTVLDNAAQLAATQPTALFHLLNRAKEDSFSLLLCARTAPDSWGVELPDLMSRLKALPVAKLDEPDDTLLLALFTRAMAERGMAVKPDLLDYLLPRLPRSAAGIAPFVAALDHYALAQGRGLTLSVIRAFLTGSGSEL